MVLFQRSAGAGVFLLGAGNGDRFGHLGVWKREDPFRFSGAGKEKKREFWGLIPASLLGIVSPLCMYGTIPIAASFSRKE